MLREKCGTKNSRNNEYFSHRYICKLHALQPGELLSRWDDQMLKMIPFIYFLRLLGSFQPREKKKFPASLQKLSLNGRKIFHFSRCGNATFAFKASLLRFTFSIIFKVHKNFRRWIYFSSSGFAWCFLWGTIGNNLRVQNWKCKWGKIVVCVRNSQKYRGKQSKFHVWASKCFLP